ncbi:UTP-hexose-1-phosphate uridylyltransferase [Alkalibacterium putridalgicola]|uniref:Galactose-1-phosphate uridylyltransferase n=1 Tax=Alkalibacterium putridalgicola TaxID=426703 RepID=A0A1H7UWM5_9LACT|nr:UDP-glucose--hexose-1-phosphate uridylyltransferase [Alkalibacterium putridalgicola]GEK89541.1 galactose-1-phosphate uridylyltransferase [Alkalibacterium putridalgicola]SEM01234.1 UTP-hexose-1-phosphate uridylyltransferase [Alkalibacterium putridalgicola]
MNKTVSEETIDQIITDFLEYYIQTGKVDALDRIYLTNRLLDLLGKKEFRQIEPSGEIKQPLELLDAMVVYAVESEAIEDLSSSKDVFGAKVMDLVTPRPSEVNQLFWEHYEKGPKEATDVFFDLSRQNNYIKTREIAKNIEYTHATEYGDLEITINLSKPEKDPKEIALAGKSETNYPECKLCMENEGYEGHLTHPGRANHRIVRMDVNGEEWGFQYSPYAYYNEHSIFLSRVHRKMDVGVQAIRNLLDILTTLPHYFVGSNAGLPIVGGSILSHDHYQGGRHTFPLERAEADYSFEMSGSSEVETSVIKWPMSVIRLSGTDKEAVVEKADRIMQYWETYSDESVGIYAETDGTPHNAVTPIARRDGEKYELDLVLRNNRTSENYPDGIFHPHPPVQHIKKENIGLIEVMGLAILPPRLKDELQTVREYLTGKQTAVDPIHQEWADELKKQYEITEENVEEIVDEAVGDIFLQVLKDAGVFKRDKEGKAAFKRFIDALIKD